jgi:hypothetical protein
MMLRKIISGGGSPRRWRFVYIPLVIFGAGLLLGLRYVAWLGLFLFVALIFTDNILTAWRQSRVERLAAVLKVLGSALVAAGLVFWFPQPTLVALAGALLLFVAGTIKAVWDLRTGRSRCIE